MLGVGTRWSDFTTASQSRRSQRPGRALRQPQRRARSTPSSTPALPLVADARVGARGAARGARRHCARRPGAARERARRALAAEWDATVERAYTLGHGPLPAQSEVHRRRQPRRAARATSSSAPRARCPATCTSCGARATRRATTSSTATRAWATRSPAARRQAGRARARGLRDGRRRLVPDDGPGDRHRRRGGHQARRSCSSRTTASPRSARCRGRSARSASARTTARGTNGALPVDDAAGDALAQPADALPVDLAANAESLGARVIRTRTIAELRARARRRPRRRRPGRRPHRDRPLAGGRTTRRGGTCRSPRSATMTPSAPPREAYERARAPSAST